MVFIHSGGWESGSRVEFEYDIQRAAAKGYIAVTVDYRLTTDTEKGKSKYYVFPAQVNDVKCAVRWLRANADRYGIDSGHIGVIGYSAGGHLALMLGLTKPSDGLEGEGGNGGYSSSVQAVVNMAGPTDLSRPFQFGALEVQHFLGGTPQEVPEVCIRASPLTYVRKDSPPILSIYGDIDEDVPLEQATLLDARMSEVGASHSLIVRQGKGHQELVLDPAVWEAAWVFFAKRLKRLE